MTPGGIAFEPGAWFSNGMNNFWQLPEPIVVLSDLHIGHSASRVRMAEEIARLIPSAGAVVFNGDTVEEKTPSHRDQVPRVMEKLSTLAAERGSEAIFLTGNHDPTISTLTHLFCCGGRVLIMHGHGIFPDVTPWSRHGRRVRVMHPLPKGEDLTFEKRLDRANRIALEMQVDDVGHQGKWRVRLLQFYREVLHPTGPYQILKAWIETPDLTRRLVGSSFADVRVVLIGHTHLPGVWKRHPMAVVNTGSFSLPIDRTAAIIQDDEVAVHLVTRGHLGYDFGRCLHRLALK